MKLRRLEPEREFIYSIGNALQKVLNHPAPPDIRPCQNCVIPCSCSGSLTCGCDCNPSCEYLPTSLTSDPEKHPLETGIIPLVYAIGCLEGCDTYWSCAGHENDQGKILKPPRVWFYARSVVHPRLIQQFLADLMGSGELHHPWHVCVTFSDFDNPDSGFSVEPELEIQADMTLSQLHEDIGIIAKNLVSRVKKGADYLLKNALKPLEAKHHRPGSSTSTS